MMIIRQVKIPIIFLCILLTSCNNTRNEFSPDPKTLVSDYFESKGIDPKQSDNEFIFILNSNLTEPQAIEDLNKIFIQNHIDLNLPVRTMKTGKPRGSGGLIAEPIIVFTFDPDGVTCSYTMLKHFLTSDHSERFTVVLPTTCGSSSEPTR